MKNLSFILVFFMALLFSSVEANAQSYVDRNEAIVLVQMEIDAHKELAQTIEEESLVLRENLIVRCGESLLEFLKSEGYSTESAIKKTAILFNKTEDATFKVLFPTSVYDELLKN